MIKKFTPVIIFFVVALSSRSFAQNSILVNFGTASCTDANSPSFSFIKDPLGVSPSQLTSCSLVNQLPDIFSVFIAYNPKNNKIYVADIRSGFTKIWVLDMGLPQNITCPDLTSTTPDYTYSYVSNNFEFDNNGDLWSFSNYNDTTGICNIDKFDVTTGNVINTRQVQFPKGNFPTTISSGDFTILPNGRMFATLGADSSKLYEILNYNNTNTNATAVYLTTLPQNCYGIAYLNGELEITGSDFLGNCYYYLYDITHKKLDAAKSFQDGQLPIDNTSITPSLGVTKQLLNAVKINTNTADLTYEVYVANLGNVALNNINVTDDLAKVYGVSNISAVSAEFVAGSNAAGLVLDPLYNGNTNKELLVAGQNLPNQTSVNTDYFFKVRVSCRVTNIKTGSVYLNSAVGSATIGSLGTLSFINVSDSSNNGTEAAVDPNDNGNAGEVGENVPTPFATAALPVHFISVAASLIDKNSSLVNWVVATPTINADKFEIEYSTDRENWNSLSTIKITNANQGNYQLVHNNLPSGYIYYRIKQIDGDGNFIFSNIVLLRNYNTSGNIVIFPNPATDHISINAPLSVSGKTEVMLYDAVGKRLTYKIMTGTTLDIKTTGLPDGSYVLKIINGESIKTQKVLVMHK